MTYILKWHWLDWYHIYNNINVFSIGRLFIFVIAALKSLPSDTKRMLWHVSPPFKKPRPLVAVGKLYMWEPLLRQPKVSGAPNRVVKQIERSTCVMSIGTFFFSPSSAAIYDGPLALLIMFLHQNILAWWWFDHRLNVVYIRLVWSLSCNLNKHYISKGLYRYTYSHMDAPTIYI